eukprot:6469610-Amphidinium_carterae.1
MALLEEQEQQGYVEVESQLEAMTVFEKNTASLLQPEPPSDPPPAHLLQETTPVQVEEPPALPRSNRPKAPQLPPPPLVAATTATAAASSNQLPPIFINVPSLPASHEPAESGVRKEKRKRREAEKELEE